MRAGRVLVVLLAVLFAGTACGTKDGPATPGSDRGFVSGSGAVTIIAPDDRGEPVVLSGQKVGGGELDVVALRGKVVLLNVWGSWCPPCRKEAPALKLVADEYADKDVQFIGILVRDDVASAKAFNRKVGITYPSIDDYSNRNGLGFAKSLPAQAIPTTWIIDAQGRVAVRIVSDSLTASTLAGLIDDVQDGAA